jgi:hypothetical protein
MNISLNRSYYLQHFPLLCGTLLVRKGGRGERGAKSAAGRVTRPVVLGFALSCLDAHNLEETSRSCVAVSPFLTGNPSKGEPQVEHLFKTAG